jgi:pilus assembly protein CpaF
MFEAVITTNKGTHVDTIMASEKKTLIGKGKFCDIVLRGWKVGTEHACFYIEDDGIYILDLKNGSAGVSVNGTKAEKHGPINDGDLIAIDSYVLKIRNLGVVGGKARSDVSASSKAVDNADADQLAVAVSAETGVSESQTTPPSNELEEVPVNNVIELAKAERKVAIELSREWRAKMHDALLKQMDLRRVNVKDMDDQQVLEITQTMLTKITNEFTDFPDSLNRKALVKQVLDESIGLGPLEDLIADDDISEIMVNCADEIFYEKRGELHLSEVTFTNDRAVQYAIERIVTPLGRRIDESSPMVDARLKDGSRVNAIIPPLALKGSSITIRKFMKEKLTAKHLVNFGSMDQRMVDFIETVVTNKQNILISGGTGSGKTTLLNVCSNYIPDNERIVTVEDSAELKLYQPNLVGLEARPPNQEGKGAVEIRDLVKNCLRMRPDRIIIGECRGGEALDMLQAMNTGHDGSLTTAHANSPRDCISRVEVMVMMAGVELPILAIREQIASAINIIIQQTRFPCGTRKVTSICEVTGIDQGVVQLGEIFKFKKTGRDENGKTKGEFIATGLVPRIADELREQGLPIDINIFSREDSPGS